MRYSGFGQGSYFIICFFPLPFCFSEDYFLCLLERAPMLISPAETSVSNVSPFFHLLRPLQRFSQVESFSPLPLDGRVMIFRRPWFGCTVFNPSCPLHFFRCNPLLCGLPLMQCVLFVSVVCLERFFLVGPPQPQLPSIKISSKKMLFCLPFFSSCFF